MERSLLFYASCVLLPIFGRILFSEAASDEWSYSGSHGPKYWEKNYPECHGKFQSPINIAKTREKKSMQHLHLKNYEKELVEPELINNGHTVKLKVKESRATLSGGCLDGEYVFDHLHFHWGSENDFGSEHTVNDKHFAMEMHLVHINKKYDNLEEAKVNGDGLAVLGVFFQVKNYNSSSLDPLVKAARHIKYIEIPVPIDDDSLTLESLLPLEENRHFYCYRNGSLTTPDCSPAVTFTLFSSPLHIGQKQMKVFRSLRYGNSTSSPYMMDNFRPIQDTNKRKIYFYNDSRTLRPVMAVVFLLAFWTTM